MAKRDPSMSRLAEPVNMLNYESYVLRMAAANGRPWSPDRRIGWLLQFATRAREAADRAEGIANRIANAQE